MCLLARPFLAGRQVVADQAAELHKRRPGTAEARLFESRDADAKERRGRTRVAILAAGWRDGFGLFHRENYTLEGRRRPECGQATEPDMHGKSQARILRSAVGVLPKCPALQTKEAIWRA